METLGKYDVVYSWGVLHHTGAMWVAIELALERVRAGGMFSIAIYNDQGVKSHIWWLVKWFYNKLPWPMNKVYAYTFGLIAHAVNVLKYTAKLQPMTAIRPFLEYKKRRGMSVMHDLIDWIGGFPFEFARFDVLEGYMKVRGFHLERGKRGQSLGCHEMVFTSPSD